ncbi:MAG: hypothetical protein ACJ72N_28770 [Labedaea sp.]
MALVLALSSACGQQVTGEAVAAEGAAAKSSVPLPRPSSRPRPSATSARPSSTAGPASSAELAGLAGTWEGEYTCAQGNTGLTLTIKAPQNAVLPTVFAFFPLPGNATAKKGSYSMVGSLSPSGQLRFTQERWIEQPTGYVMVDLTVTSPVEAGVSQLSGDVLDPACKGFSVRRR